MAKARYLYSELSSAIQAYKNCEASKNEEWRHKHMETIDMLCQLLPSGSGIDSGTKLNLDASHYEKLVFDADYHHMDENGYYDGWTQHTVTVAGGFHGIRMRISGKNRNEIKNYLYEEFDYALSQDVRYQLYTLRFPQYKIVHTWKDQCTQEFSVCLNPGIESNEMEFRVFQNLKDAREFVVKLIEEKEGL